MQQLTPNLRAMGRFAAVLLLSGAAAFPSGAAADPLGASAPENLRCPGRQAPALPGPGWTVSPVWAWQNLVQVPGDVGSSDGPRAVALDHQCNVYVTDSQHFSVLKLGPDGTQPAQWSLPGQRAAGESSSPRGIAVDNQGFMYVTDTSRNPACTRFSSQGQLSATWGDCPNGGNACDPTLPGRFNSPEGIAVDGAGNVFVAETAGNRLQKLSSSGKSLAVWSLSDKGLGAQLIPGSLSVDQGGYVYMTEAYNNWVVKFDPNSGAVVGKWGGTQGGASGQLHRAAGRRRRHGRQHVRERCAELARGGAWSGRFVRGPVAQLPGRRSAMPVSRLRHQSGPVHGIARHHGRRPGHSVRCRHRQQTRGTADDRGLDALPAAGCAEPTLSGG